MTLWAMAGYGTGEDRDRRCGGRGRERSHAADVRGGRERVAALQRRVSRWRDHEPAAERPRQPSRRAEVDGSETLARTAGQRQPAAAHARRGVRPEARLGRDALALARIRHTERRRGRRDRRRCRGPGGGLRYSDPASGITPRGPGPDAPVARRRPRGVGRERTGADRSRRVGPGGSRSGLRPAWGETAGGVRRLWGGRRDRPGGGSGRARGPDV